MQRKLGYELPGLDLNSYFKKNLLWLKMSKGPWYVKHCLVTELKQGLFFVS